MVGSVAGVVLFSFSMASPILTELVVVCSTEAAKIAANDPEVPSRISVGDGDGVGELTAEVEDGATVYEEGSVTEPAEVEEMGSMPCGVANDVGRERQTSSRSFFVEGFSSSPSLHATVSRGFSRMEVRPPVVVLVVVVRGLAKDPSVGREEASGEGTTNDKVGVVVSVGVVDGAPEEGCLRGSPPGGIPVSEMV